MRFNLLVFLQQWSLLPSITCWKELQLSACRIWTWCWDWTNLWASSTTLPVCTTRLLGEVKKVVKFVRKKSRILWDVPSAQETFFVINFFEICGIEFSSQQEDGRSSSGQGTTIWAAFGYWICNENPELRDFTRLFFGEKSDWATLQFPKKEGNSSKIRRGTLTFTI